MQRPLPLKRITRYVGIITVLCNLHLSVISQTIYVAPSGNDVSGDGTAGNPYRTITQGIAIASAGNTIQLGSGTYNELVVINKPVTIDGVNAGQTTVNYTGTIADYSTAGTVLPTLFKVTAQNVVIKNINFIVQLNIVHSAIHTSGDASGLQVLNNIITASRNGLPSSLPAFTALAYARTNAIALNPSISYGASKYSTAPAGLSNVKVSGNFISGSTLAQNGFADAAFRAGVYADNAYALLVGGTTAEKNTIQTGNHDVIMRFFMNGDVTIRNNEFNGGGVELSTSNTSTGTILVDSNYFNFLAPAVPAYALLRLMSGNINKTTIVKGNTFYNSNWYISLGNYNTVLVDSNFFTPVIKDPGAHNDFRLITVNSKVIQTSATTKVLNNATFTRNQFNGAAGANGIAMAFYNHDAVGSSFGLYSVGGPGKENNFNANISRFFYVDNSNGQSTTSMTGNYPEYSGVFNTTTAWWTQNILAPQNWYEIGAGSPMKPDAMDAAQKNTLNAMITDQLDDASIGMVLLYNILLALPPANTNPRSTPRQPGITYQLYPNPVTTNLNARVDTQKKQPVQLRLFNMNGHCLQTRYGTSNNTIQLEMTRWPAGIYTVELVTAGSSRVQQIIKR
ncbi:T9SS type A sorting domain-containing protein [Paraflavitalea soli]|nr:T9SS type A sorting domain-containing protein [Paraflavitalea soli]